MRIVRRMALFSSLYYSERVRGTYAHVCESETVGGRAQVLPLTMQHNGARGSARRRAARRRASGSEWPPSPRLRDLAVVELGRPPGAGGACKGRPRRGACSGQETAKVRTTISICGGHWCE